MICGVPYQSVCMLCVCVCVYFFRQLCGKAIETREHFREISKENLSYLAVLKLKKGCLRRGSFIFYSLKIFYTNSQGISY